MTAIARRTGPTAWARTNLFRGPADTVTTLVAGTIGLYAIYRFANFVLVTGRWEIVRENLSLFMVGNQCKQACRKQIQPFFGFVFYSFTHVFCVLGFRVSCCFLCVTS